MQTIDKAISAAVAEFDSSLARLGERCQALNAAYARRDSIAPIVERVKEIADAAIDALRFCDRAAELEKFRDSK